MVRVPAIEKFVGTNFSMSLPLPGEIQTLVEEFRPDVIHSHHPFLMGDLALRLCGQNKIPLVFTYHTMFANTNDVKDITGKIVNNQLVTRAQYVIETYDGKLEAEITNTKDLEILKRAVAYQAAYMENNEDLVYEQMSVSTTGQNDAYTTFRQNDNASPWIAPLAVMVCSKLSFIKSRSILTGKISRTISFPDWTTL